MTFNVRRFESSWMIAALLSMSFALYIVAPKGNPFVFKHPYASPASVEATKTIIRCLESCRHQGFEDSFQIPDCLRPKEEVRSSLPQNQTNNGQSSPFSAIPIRFSSSLVSLTQISSRKEIFINNLLPSILAYNEEIQAERNYLLILKKLTDSGKSLTKRQNRWLNQLALKYKLRHVTLPELLKRVDVIPPSLALGQAVIETGWGGSLAAQRLNSPFGMMRTAKDVFSYKSLQESVTHYIHNLNTHDAYASMRTIRSELRMTGEQLCSLKLLKGLTRYSSQGTFYTSRVKKIIESFKFQEYDRTVSILTVQKASSQDVSRI